MTAFFRLWRVLAAGALLAATPTSRAYAADMFIIANTDLAVSAEDVKEIFLGEVQFSGSLKMLPVDNAGAQNEFLARVLKISNAKYSASWTKKSFRDGLNAPPVKATDAEVIVFVKNNPGAIGYVTSAPPGVHVVSKF